MQILQLAMEIRDLQETSYIDKLTSSYLQYHKTTLFFLCTSYLRGEEKEAGTLFFQEESREDTSTTENPGNNEDLVRGSVHLTRGMLCPFTLTLSHDFLLFLFQQLPNSWNIYLIFCFYNVCICICWMQYHTTHTHTCVQVH